MFKKLPYKLILSLRPIFILSYPKSGRTWLRVILNDLELNPAFEHLQTKFTFLKPPTEVMDGLESLYGKRVIFLYRDPRDVVVSAYYYYKNNKGLHDCSMKEFIRSPNMGFEKVVAFNDFVLQHSDHFKAFLPISYEEMRKDPVPIVKKCLNFMAIPHLNSSKIQRAVEKNDFKNMQKREKEKELLNEYGEGLFSAPKKDGTEQALKVRRGKVSGYLDEFDDDDLTYCNEIMKKYDTYK